MVPGKSVFLLLKKFSPETHPPYKVECQDVWIRWRRQMNVKRNIIFFFKREKI